MERFWKSASWVSRLVLAPPILIFALIASRYIAHPVEAAAAVGISLQTGMGTTVARVGFGGFPLACSLFLLTCLLSKSRVRMGLSFVAMLVGVVLIVRLVGMQLDASAAENMKLVGAEVGLLIITAIGLALDLRPRHV